MPMTYIAYNKNIHMHLYATSRYSNTTVKYSYSAKLEDLIRDETMRQTNIMCFTETFLTSHQQIDHQYLPIQEECVIFRLDREHNTIEDLYKGGVMIICPKSLKPVRISIHTQPQFEVVAIIATTLNSNEQICVVAVYRRPQLPLGVFLPLMNDLISNLPPIAPTIIVGDFNDNLLAASRLSTLSQFMSLRQFTQLVQVPTTDSGTLLDHVYCNATYENMYIDVIDTYYSDHDAVYLSIPI